MADPWEVFRASPERQDTLKLLWQELYDALSPTAQQLDDKAVRRCTQAEHADTPINARPYAAGRISLNHGFACEACIVKYSARPGGYPLALTDPREFS